MLVREGLLLDPAVTGEIAWALLHFIWQGIVLAALLWLALRIPGQPARTRYFAAAVTLVLMLLAPVVTYWTIRGDFDDPGPLKLPPKLALLMEPAAPGADPGEIAAFPSEPAVMDGLYTGIDGGSSGIAFTLPVRWSLMLQRAVPWIALGWFAFALLLAVRQWVSMFMLHLSLKRNTAPLRDGNERFAELPARVGVKRRVTFLECSLLRAPATVGWLRPVVLVPSYALDTLWPRQLDALVTHELAHIRRNDYVINIVQLVVESILAFHPAVWWVSARVREEREACCDELAVDVVGSRKEYAAALATMDQLPRGLLPAETALSAAGGPLLRRVRRIAMSASKPFGHRSSSLSLAAVIGPLVTAGVLFLAGAQLIATSVDVTPPRGLSDIGALGATVYEAMGITSTKDAVGGLLDGLPGGEILDQIRNVLVSTDWDQKRFDERSLGDLVEVVLHETHSDVLASVQLPLTDVMYRTSHEGRLEWAYGSSHQRRKIRMALVNRARVLAHSDPEIGRHYARAALLLAAQEGAINGTLDLGRLLDQMDIDVLAGLSERESKRIRRAMHDHRVVLRAAVQQRRRAEYALSLLSAHRTGMEKLDPREVEALRQDTIDAIASIVRVSRGRPDMQWVVANLCWMARSVLPQRDADRLFEQVKGSLSGTGAAHLEQWLADAHIEPPPERIPRAVERLTDDVGRAVRRRIDSSTRPAGTKFH